MALSQRLEMRQGQSLVMTPQLQQAIKLLQMSNFELQAFVEAELEKNPLLEREERVEVAPQPEAPSPADTGVDTGMQDNAPPTEKFESLGTDLENVYADEARADAVNRMVAGEGPADSGWASLRASGAVSLDADGMDFGATLTRAETLSEHLNDQLALSAVSPAERLIGQHLIAMIDEAGYLTGDVATTAEMLGAPAPAVEKVLDIIQSFDPPGVGARNLAECLAIQLKERDHRYH